MRLEALRLKNFRAFRDLHLRDLTRFCVVVGANGTGKSTLFAVFDFLRDAMASNVTAALGRLGGSRGFEEVRTRGATGPIEIELTLGAGANDEPSTRLTYELVVDEEGGRPVVIREVLTRHRGDHEAPWTLLNFSRGRGDAVTREDDTVRDEADLPREAQSLKSADLLALKGLAQFERYPAAVALGEFIERWHLSDVHIRRAQAEQEAGYAEHLSREGENLSHVVAFLQKRHPAVFARILATLARRVPGLRRVESKVTEEGRVLLKFQDGAFEDPFLARFVSDGTIKMLAYLVLLYDPAPHPLLCVEEPENQLYPSLLAELAEEFRAYADRGGQVFVSTHSPDFLNAVEPSEVWWLVKRDGYTTAVRASDDAQVAALVAEGDKLGWLWKQGLFSEVDPT